MELGKYQNVLRAIKRKSGGLRTVVYDPSIDNTTVDFPDIEQPKMEFAGGGAVKKIIKRILSPDDLRQLGKKEGIPEEDIEKFLKGEYGLLKRAQARGVVKRDKDGNIFVKDTYSKKYDPIRKQMLKDDPGMFDDLFDRMFGEYELEQFKKSGRKPNADGGVVQREGFDKGGFSKFKYKTLEEFQKAMQEQVDIINAEDFFDSNNLAKKRIAEHFGFKNFESIKPSVKQIVNDNLIRTETKVKNHFKNVVDDIYNIPYDDIVDAGGFTKYISKPFNFKNRKRVSNLLKDDPDFKAISNLSQRLSGNNTLKTYGGKDLLVADVIDQLDIKRVGIFNKGLGFGYKIGDIVDRSIKSGNKDIKFVKGYEIGKVDDANVLFEMDGKIYGVDPDFDKINGKKIINVNQVGETLPEFENIKLAYEQANARANKPVLFNGKETTYGDLLKETYAKGYGKDTYYKQNPYEVDHLNIKDNPFDNVRVLPRHINQAAGSIKRTTSIIKGDEAKAKALNKVGYNIPEEAIDNSVLKFADRVINKKQKLNTAYDVAKLNLIRPDTDPYYKIPEEKLSFEEVQIGDKKRQAKFTKEQSYVETPTGKRPVSPKEKIPVDYKSSKNVDILSKNLKKIKPQDAVNAISNLACEDKYTDGSRVEFKKGSNCFLKGAEIINDAKAGNPSALQKVRKYLKTPAAKVGLGALVELGLEGLFAVESIAEGKPYDQVLGESLFGLVGFGSTEEEQILKHADPKDIEKVKAYQKKLANEGKLDSNVAFEKMVQPETGEESTEDFFTVESLRPAMDEQRKQLQKDFLDPNLDTEEEAYGRAFRNYIEANKERAESGDFGRTLTQSIKKNIYDPVGEKIMQAYEAVENLFAEGGRVGMSEGGDPKDKMKTPFDKPTVPIDPNQIPQVQNPGRRGFIKGVGFIGAGIAAFAAGLLRLGRKDSAKKLVQKAATYGGRRIDGVPEIISDLIQTIKLKGKVIDAPKPGSGPVVYQFEKYEYAEDINGFSVSKINDRGDYGYSEEVFQFEKDLETGATFFDDITVRPDGDGKLKDVEYGVDMDTYDEIADDLARFNHIHPNDTRFKDKARKWIDEEKLKNEGIEPKPGTELD